MTRKRMEHADEEFRSNLAFMESSSADKPFFIWHNTTRVCTWTRLQEKYRKSGISIYADGMLEHDDQVGILLDKLDELKNRSTLLIARVFLFPLITVYPYLGLMVVQLTSTVRKVRLTKVVRVPQLVAGPGVIKPGSKINDNMAHQDLSDPYSSSGSWWW